jgi:hypothetical protein
MSEQSLPDRYAAAVQRGRDLAQQAGARYEETPAWRANERTVEAVWREARAAGHTVAELMEATAIRGDG